jgi:hypothetical protein
MADQATTNKKKGSPGSRNPKPGSRFYDSVLTQEEIASLAELAMGPSLSDEIALLKVLIRRKLEEGADLADISKAVDTLGRALKVQKQISAAGHKALQDALVAVLEELSAE